MQRNTPSQASKTNAPRKTAPALLLGILTLSLALLPAVPVAAHTDGTPCSYLVPDQTGCTEAPHSMVSWWPFDEGPTAALAHDNIGPNDAFPAGDAVRGPGYVANAWDFDTSGDLARAPDDLTLHPGVGDLSIDAWVRTETYKGYQTILDKRGLLSVQRLQFDTAESLEAALDQFQAAGQIVERVNDLWLLVYSIVGDPRDIVDDVNGGIAPLGSFLQGYHFYIENGRLAFRMITHGFGTTFYGPAVGDGAWHLVAVTVDRDQPNGGTFYVDGAPVATFDPTLHQSTLDNLHDAILGRFQTEYPDAQHWTLDEVELFHRVLAPGEIASLFEAQERGKCKLGCEVPLIETFRVDTGATPNSARPAFDTGITYPFRRTVDQTGVNKAFLHTFDNLPDDIVAATLEFRVVSQGELSYNDNIHLGYDAGTYGWGRHFGSYGLVTGFLPQTWSSGTSLERLLDLDALPKADLSTVSLIETMNDDGYLDVYIQDDTLVDYLELTIVVCDCELQPADIVLQGGVEDDFDPNANAPELTTQTPALLLRNQNCSLGATPRFDETAINQCFGYSFVVDQRIECLEYATLEIRARSSGGLAHNDGISIGYDALSDSFDWTSSFSSLPESGGSWSTAGQKATFTIDVGAVSPAAMTRLLQTGLLEVHVYDDTSIDYVKLSLKECCDEKSDLEETLDSVKQALPF